MTKDMMEPKGDTLQDCVMAPICSHLLKICYFIALIDLLQSLFFLFQSFGLLTINVDPYSITAFLGSVFWIFMVGLLLMGLWKGRLAFIIGWLCFSIVGIVLDILFFIWTIYISERIEWSQIIRFTLLYFGIVFEWFCVYVVYHYCLRIKPPAVEEPENGNAKSNRFQIKKTKSKSSKLESSDQPEKEKSKRSAITKSTMESEHGKSSRKSKTETSDQTVDKTDSHQSKEKEKSNKRDGKGNENRKKRNSKR